jgi:hypothetical protein
MVVLYVKNKYMSIRKDILQKFIDEGDDYLIGNRYVEGMGASRGKDDWYAVFLSANIDRELWGKKIGELPYNTVENFAEKEIMTNLHLGGTYPPFQYGIRYKDFISLEKVTCNSNELINKCYQENIKDYYEVVKIMKELTQKDKQDESN